MAWVRCSSSSLLALLFLGGTTSAQSAAAWRDDLHLLAAELPARHANAFARMTRGQWDSAVRRLDERIPSIPRHEFIMGLMRLVALVHDGHTFVPLEPTGFRSLPIGLYSFSDGLFVVSADSAHADLVGARVLRIGGLPAAAAMDSASTLVSYESPQWARERAPGLLAIPEVLAGLHLSESADRAEFTIEQDGRERTVTLSAGESARLTVDMADQRPGELPLWRQHPGTNWWFAVLPDHTLYICYRGVQFFAEGELNEAFFRRVFAAGDSAGVERVVLDMRTNGGGNNFLNKFVVKEIIRRPALDRPDRLFVLIGRGVFSAAQNLVNELDYYTGATFVGEPTGNAPNQYGDPRPLDLPNSKLRVFVSSLFWEGHAAGDRRNWFPPDVFVETTSADYRAKRDPVLAAALRWATAPTLAARLAPDAARGDTAAVRRTVEAWRSDPETRYRDIEMDVNAAGYERMSTGDMMSAATIMRVNARLFPTSANAFDSLGDAMEKSGRRDEAIAAYRRALALNPRMFSSAAGLKRLGVSP